MSFDEQTIEGIKSEAKTLGVDWQALAAVAQVESAGKPLWDGLCPIRIEGHYFDARLSGSKRDQARKAKLSSPVVGVVKNPAKMARRYAMLEEMKAIDEDAALESVSWGLGQVMGAHWSKLGYASVQSLAQAAQASTGGQIQLMSRYIREFGLLPELKSKDWDGFAEKYNGKNYKQYAYHTKMAEVYELFVHGAVKKKKTTSNFDDVLERGDNGAAVIDLQHKLSSFEYYKGAIDGVFGGASELAIMDFQRDALIQVNGRAGPQTMKVLASWTEKKTEKAKTEGRARVVYVNQHATRNRPATPFLETKLSSAIFTVYGAGYEAQIYSGGQARKGTPGKRTGSIRHDDYGEGGRALDAYVLDPKGRKLEGPELAKLGKYWLAERFGGCGIEMAVGGIHLDEWKIPPPGGAMFWLYPYTDTRPWASIVRQMLTDGAGGQKA